MTVLRVSKLRFMWQPSFNLAPVDNAWEARSLPAKSTKFCTKHQFGTTQFSNFSLKNDKMPKTLSREFLVLTTLAERVVEFSLPKNSRAELSII